jgi:hypothetical protein
MKIQSKDLGLLKQLINKLEQEREQALVAAEDANIQLQIIAEQYLAQIRELEACKTSLEAHWKLLDDKEKAAQHYHSALIRSARQIRQEEADRSMIFEELQLVRDQAEARWRLLLPGAPAAGSLEHLIDFHFAVQRHRRELDDQAGAQRLSHDLHLGHAEGEFRRDLPVGPVEAHDVQAQYPGPQRPRLTTNSDQSRRRRGRHSLCSDSVAGSIFCPWNR